MLVSRRNDRAPSGRRRIGVGSPASSPPYPWALTERVLSATQRFPAPYLAVDCQKPHRWGMPHMEEPHLWNGGSPRSTQLSRRRALKMGAVVVGAAWIAPVIQPFPLDAASADVTSSLPKKEGAVLSERGGVTPSDGRVASDREQVAQRQAVELRSADSARADQSPRLSGAPVDAGQTGAVLGASGTRGAAAASPATPATPTRAEIFLTG